MINPLIWSIPGWLGLALLLACLLLVFFVFSSRSAGDRLRRHNNKLQRQLDELLGVENRLKAKQREGDDLRDDFERQLSGLAEQKKVCQRETELARARAGELEQKWQASQKQAADMSQQAVRFQEDSRKTRQELEKANALAAELIVKRDDALARLKEAQEKLVKTERLAAVSAMVISINHEINNPLTSVSLSIQTMLKRLAEDKALPKDEMLTFLNISNRETERIKKIVAKIKDITELEEIDYLPGLKMISLDKSQEKS